MDNKEILDDLLEGDKDVLRQFFFEKCRPLFTSIINRVFSYHVDYDEFVSELYLFLMENDAARLKQFEGRSSIYQWLKTVALRFAMKLRNEDVLIDVCPKNPLYLQDIQGVPSDNAPKHAKMDIEALLQQMTNERQVYVIRRHLIDGIDEPTLAEEMGIKVSNLYNIKKRAMTALMKVALNDIQQYGKTRE